MKLFYSFAVQFSNALVAELVDALDSKSSVFGRVGSIPTQGTSKTFLFWEGFLFWHLS